VRFCNDVSLLVFGQIPRAKLIGLDPGQGSAGPRKASAKAQRGVGGKFRDLARFGAICVGGVPVLTTMKRCLLES
jgi:hypothetical protein